MGLFHAFGMQKADKYIEHAVSKTLQDGFRTSDIMEKEKTLLGTIEITDKVRERL